MTKTLNYQLNQWDASDPIRREDFNADNAALDAALEEVSRATIAPVLLRTVVQEATAGVSLDVSGLELSRYHYLWLDLYQPAENSSDVSVILSANGLTNGYYTCTSTSSMTGSSLGSYSIYPLGKSLTLLRLIIPVYRQGSTKLIVRRENIDTYYRHNSLTVAALETLDFTASSDAIPAGTVFVLQGVR